MRIEQRSVPALCATLAISVGIGCAGPHKSPSAESTSQPAVAQFGTMRDVMREGRTEARISLVDAVAEPHAVAVGALEGLAGEVTIVDSEVWVSRTDAGQLRVTGPESIAGDRATLLTLAHVGTWQAVPIESTAEGAALEALIERSARARGIDTTRPFPFLIDGTLTTIDLHVVNGFCPIAVDPAPVDAQPWRWSSARPTEVRIVGFYAPDAPGVMTHHGSSLHVHAILSVDGTVLTGHIDRVVVEPGMVLRIPGG